MKKSYSDEFKFKVALEACSNKSTLAELSKKYNGLAPSLIQKWKAHLKAQGYQVFSKTPFKPINKIYEEKCNKLYQQIGRLTVEKEYLKKNSVE